MTTPRKSNGVANAGPPVIHCGVYCRKSTDENLDSAFNSLDAQREACLAYITSQKHAGWVPFTATFEDGGFSGGTLERPALKRLLAEIEAGRVQCVLVYRADRLSRRIIDFLQLMELFDRHGVSFVSVTEQFNTATPGGRLYQHMLLSFAQYERDLIAERTRHKVHAARRKGKFTGGTLFLGFDCDPKGGRLVVNDAEAERVREIFRLFIERPSMVALSQELNERGWTLKRWTTREGRAVGGGAFDRLSLRRLLVNHAYIGKVNFEGTVYDAEHPPIVDQETWNRAQELLNQGPREQMPRGRNGSALLGGILYCAPCGAAMTPTFSQKGRVRYRYYVCHRAHRRGWATCPSKSVPAVEIEKFVVDRLRAMGNDPELVGKTVEEAGKQLTARKAELEAETKHIGVSLKQARAVLRKQAQAVSKAGSAFVRSGLAAQEEVVCAFQDRLFAVRERLDTLKTLRVDSEEPGAALKEFDPMWAQLAPAEQSRVVHLLIGRIDYDGGKGSLVMSFRPEGARLLAAGAPGAAEASA